MSHMHAPPAPQRHDSPLPDNSSQHGVASGRTFRTTDAAHKNDTRSTETMTNENNKPSFHQPLRSIMYKLSLSCNSNSNSNSSNSNSNSNNSSESRSSRNRNSNSNSSKSKQRKHRQLATRPKNHVVENIIREDVAALMENPTSSSRSIVTNEPHGASNPVAAASRTSLSDERRDNSHQQNLGNSSSTTFDTTCSGDDDDGSSSVRSDTRRRTNSNGVPRVIVAPAAAAQAAGANDAIISTINTRINSLHLSTSGTGRGITPSRPEPPALRESANDENHFNSSSSSSRSNRRGTTRNRTTEAVPVVSTVPRHRRHHHNGTPPHATTTTTTTTTNSVPPPAAAPVGARPNRGPQQRPRGNVGPTDQQTTLPRPHTTSAPVAPVGVAAAVGTGMEDLNAGFRPTTGHVPMTDHPQPTLNDDDNDDKAFQKAKSILAAGPVELKGRIKFEPTALLESVAAADFKEVRMLLSYGANPNAAIPATTTTTTTTNRTTTTTCHETALAMAVKAGHLYIAALLLANGATIATTPTIDDSTAAPHHATAARRRRRSHYHCTTVLHHACAAGHMSIVRLLLFHLQQQQRQKGEPNAAADHALALADDDPSSFAALHQQLPASAMMLLHWTDVQGRTPLFWASHRGHTAVVRLLLEYGAGSDLFTTDRAGQSPLHAASSHGHVAALQLLLLAAASSSLAAAAAAAAQEEVKDDDDNEEVVGTLNEKQQQQQRQHGETAMAVYCNLPDMEGRTALDLACRHGHLAAMQVLLGHGADCNGSSGGSSSNNNILKNTTPLMEATRQENVPMIRLLLAFGASVVATPSYNSTRGGGSSSGGSSNSNTNAAANALAPLHMASRQGRADIVSLLLQDHTPAALPHILRQTDPTSGRTALHWACCRGHVEVVHLILAFLNSSTRRAGDGSTDNDPQRRRRRLQRNKVVCNIADTSYGDTPLLIAAKQRHWDAVQLLLTQGGADPNARDRMGGTALDVALKQDHWESVKLLLDHGANVNFPDRLYRRTPLHRAAYNNQLELLKLMLERGANTRARDRSSRVALHLACEQENISSIYLLFQVMVGEGSITFSSTAPQGRHKNNRNRKYRS